MRILNGIKWIGLTALISVTANAAVILDGVSIIDNSNIELLEVVLATGDDPLGGDIYIDTISKNYTVTQDNTPPPPAGDVAITRFTATPTSMSEGDTTVIRWATTDAESCEATGGGVSAGWEGTAITPLSSGSTSLTITTEGSYFLRLTCTGTNGPVFKTVNVIVEKLVVTPIPSTCTNGPLSGNAISWNSFWNTAFPGPSYDKKNITVLRNGYVALRFDTPDLDDLGGVTTIPTTYTDGRKLGAISACEGDFDVAPECKYTWGANGGIGWATNGQAGYCQLKKNTTYYLNLTFTDGVDPGSSQCATNEFCIIALRAVH